MNFARKAAALTSALVVSFGPAIAQNAAVETAPVITAPPTTEANLFANPFDKSTWFDGAGEVDIAKMGAPEAVNPATPSFWLSFMAPETHTKRHMQFTNPAQYAQFMSPKFYMQFANPQNWMTWINPTSYAVLADADTYTYWMQPGAYTHMMQPDGYMQATEADNYQEFMSPATYMQWMNPEAYDIEAITEGAADALSLIDPSSWTGAFKTASN